MLQFWRVEFAGWNERYVSEAIAPVLNKVGAFVANPVIRNIIGQPKSSFNIRQIMDEGKILIVNLSKGLIGEDNAAILGSFLVTKIQLAAMSRSDIPRIEDRRPFYLYVDEFQNFATDSFVSTDSTSPSPTNTFPRWKIPYETLSLAMSALWSRCESARRMHQS